MKIAFQGELGAYSHEACVKTYPDWEAVPCRTFQDAIESVQEERSELAMLPIENSTYGRVADVYSLLPHSGLHIIDETYVRVRIALMARRGVALGDVKTALSHVVLLGQCRKFLKEHGIATQIGPDTAGAARMVSQSERTDQGALAAKLAAQIYGLDILAENIEDQGNNTTRFLVVSRTPSVPNVSSENCKTTFIFEVRNIPAALFKALGGFATNGVNMTKLESYMVGGSFHATQFYADIQGHQDDPAVQRAFEELSYFTNSIRILGVYPAAKPPAEA